MQSDRLCGNEQSIYVSTVILQSDWVQIGLQSIMLGSMSGRAHGKQGRDEDWEQVSVHGTLTQGANGTTDRTHEG